LELTRLAVLAAICALSYVAGEALAKAHIPRLPVYLAVGAASGLLISSAVETAELTFPILSPVALCVIGFIAGSHLVWRAIKPRVKPIALQVAGMTLSVPLVVGIAVYVLLPADVLPAARLASAILAGTVMLALSPPEAIAIISESKAVGPFTGLVLGATVVMDVVVVSAFSVTLTISKALLGSEASASTLVATIVLGIGLAVLGGLLVGLLLRALVQRVSSDTVVGVLVFVLAALAVWLAFEAGEWAHARFALELEIEPLLIAMIAGLFVANLSSASGRFAVILERLAPWVYVVFFTLTGLGLHVDTLIAAAVPAAVLWILRIGGLWGGSRAAMTLAKEPPVVKRVAWRAFVPQAGIALALASTIALEFPQGGPVLSAMIIGTVVLNEASGPFFLRSALVATGEAVPAGEILD
jgi:Kef-type K+ transport system membrane component KefB